MDAVRQFENWAAPFVLIVAVFLLIWMTIQAGGFGPLVEDHGTARLGLATSGSASSRRRSWA